MLFHNEEQILIVSFQIDFLEVSLSFYIENLAFFHLHIHLFLRLQLINQIYPCYFLFQWLPID